MGSLVKASSGQLLRLEAACRALADAKSIDDAKEIRDQAQAVRHYMKQRDYSFEAQQDAAEIKLRAERRLGEMLAESGERRGAPLKSHGGTSNPLPEGVNKTQSHRWQRVASVPAPVFERHIKDARQAKEELTTASALRLAKQEASKATIESVNGHSEACTIDDLQRLVDGGKTFGCLYADPPWQYGNQGTRAATDNHYPTMDVAEIAALPLAELSAEKCHLHLWCTDSFFEEAIGLLRGWGFERRQTFVWAKPQLGIGNYWRSSHEYMLLGVKGGLTFPPTDIKSWIEHDRTRHSAKPEAVRKLIERVSPGPRLELFGRQPINGWVVWGNQVERGMFDEDVRRL